jgi:16S rRNA (guanine527-N7)-methyltransferase
MADDRLLSVLERSRSLGFLGPGPVEDHIDHARRFTRALDAVVAVDPEWLSSGVRHRPPRLADLGAGGGLPSLPVLVDQDEGGHSPLAGASAVLIDASQKRCSFLIWACTELGLSDRVEVWCGRAEEIAHQDRARFTFDLVLARGFGPPAWTVECGAPLLSAGGLLCISEPPKRRSWPADGLAAVGLSGPVLGGRDADALDDRDGGAGGRAGGDGEAGHAVAGDIAVFRRIGEVDDRFPRRAKVAGRDPLFRLEA